MDVVGSVVKNQAIVDAKIAKKILRFEHSTRTYKKNSNKKAHKLQNWQKKYIATELANFAKEFLLVGGLALAGAAEAWACLPVCVGVCNHV